MAVLENLAGFAAVGLFALAGAGLLQLLPPRYPRSLGRRMALAYLLGLAWVAGGLYALSHWLGLTLRLPAVVGVAAVPVLAGLGAALWRRSRAPRAPSRARPRRRWSWLEVAAVVVATAVVGAVFLESATTPLLDWDGRSTWAVQARYLRAAGTVDAPVLREGEWFITHPHYPLLMPVAQVAALELARADDDSVAFRPLYAAFVPVWLLAVLGLPRRRVGRAAAALALLAAALLPFVSFHTRGGATGAYSDLPLACFYGAGLSLLLQARLRAADGALAGLLLAAAVLTKSEGTPLALIALGVAAAARAVGRRRLPWPRRGLAPVGIAALVVALAIALLLSWRSGVAVRYTVEYGPLLSFQALWPEVFTRLPQLLPKMRLEMIQLRYWGFFWSVAPLVLLAGWRGLKRRGALPFALAAAAPLAMAWIVYLIVPDPELWIRTTWNRFLVQASVPFLILFSFALNDLLVRTRRAIRRQ